MIEKGKCIVTNDFIFKAVEEFNKNSKDKLEFKNKELLDSFNNNDREQEYQDYTNQQVELSDEEWCRIIDIWNSLDNVNMITTHLIPNKADN